jgi:hypothetical protein
MKTPKFSKPVLPRGSNCTRINVDYAGRPFAQLWTYKAKGELHGWHASTLSGLYGYFATVEEAACFIVGAAGCPLPEGGPELPK